MRKSIFIFLIIMIIFTFFACPNPGTNPTPIPTATPTITPIEPSIQVGKIKLALYDGLNLKFWDGEKTVTGYTGIIHSAGYRKLSINDVLYSFDEYGKSESAIKLSLIPDKIISVPKEQTRATTVYEDDVYTLIDIPPAEAYALGALYRHYTQIFKNDIEVGAWYLNQWEVDYVIQTASGHILARDKMTAWHNLTDTKNVKTAYPEGIMLYNMGTQHGYIADASGEYEVTWQYNYFDNAKHQLAGGVWYTENGYTWTPGGGVTTNANAMFAWNTYATYPASYDAPYGEKPYIIPAGVYTYNGIECTYWIETVTGKLYRHMPSINTLTALTNLYAGPYTRAGAIIYYNTLTPVISEGIMYFHADGYIWQYDFSMNLVSMFSGDEEIIPW